MRPLVIDSGALLEILLQGGAEGVEHDPSLAGRELSAPHLIDPESLSATRKLVLRKHLPPESCELLLQHFSAVSLTRYRHASLLASAWELRANITPYDAMYVSLARRLDIPLLTIDRRLARAAARYCEVSMLG